MVAIEHYAKASTSTTSDINTTVTTNTSDVGINNNNINNNINTNNNNNHHNNNSNAITLLPTEGVALSSSSSSESPASLLLTSSSSSSSTSPTSATAPTTIEKEPPYTEETINLIEKMSQLSTDESNDRNDVAKSAVSQRNIDIKISKKSNTNTDVAKQDLTKKMLKLDLSGKELDEFSLKSPKSPITARLPHQTSLTSSVDVEDRKTLRDALYQGIFHRHRRTIFAVGSFLRMLRSRNSQYNSIRSSSEGEDVDDR